MNKLTHHMSITKIKTSGFSVIEVILATAIFAIFSFGVITLVLQGFGSNRLAEEETIANQYATEGMEAARSIRNQSFASLVDSNGTGVTRNGSNVWAFSGSSDTFGKYTRVVTVSDVQRDGNGNIVSSGGTVDSNTKKVSVTVSWNYSPTRNDSVVLSSYFTNWKATLPSGNGTGPGMLVYGDGGTTSDAIKYRTFDGNNWSAAAATADVDSATSNRALRAAKLYSSSTRNEKILLTRHYDGNKQYIYAQVFNGTSWGNVQLLSSWTSKNFLDVQNFDGTYLANGNFMAVYSDNTTTAKTRQWNGTSWAGPTNLTNLGASQVPTYMVVSARPGTNEVMAAFFTQGTSTPTGNTITEYYNGTSWSGITTHATAAPFNTRRYVDFAWSPNTSTIGALVFSNNSSDVNLHVKLWQANGTGSGSWGAEAASAAQTSILSSVAVAGRNGSNEFIACDKENAGSPNILCYKVTFSGSTATVTSPTNLTVSTNSDSGIQRSFHIGYEMSSGDKGLNVFSDGSKTPELKAYTVSTSTWDSSATAISTGSFNTGVIKAVRLIPRSNSNDIMILMSDGNQDLYSVIWDGTNNAVYTTTDGKAFTQHGTNGSSNPDFWYDFAWN